MVANVCILASLLIIFYAEMKSFLWVLNHPVLLMYVPTNNYHTCSTSDEGQKAAILQNATILQNASVLPEKGINFVALSQPGHSQKKKWFLCLTLKISEWSGDKANSDDFVCIPIAWPLCTYWFFVEHNGIRYIGALSTLPLFFGQAVYSFEGIGMVRKSTNNNLLTNKCFIGIW